MDVSPEPIPPGGTTNLYVWIDFVSPYCFIGKSLLERASAGRNTRVIWMPFELRPPPKVSAKLENKYLPRAWETEIYPKAKQLGLTMQMPTISPQPYTRTAFIGMQYAIEQDAVNPYVAAVLTAFFQHNQNIGEAAVLAEIAAGIGLPREPFLAALTSKDYARRHDTALWLSRQIGVQTVPMVLVGNTLISVMNGVATLQEAIDEADKNLLN